MRTDVYEITGKQTDITTIQEGIRKMAAYNSLPEKDSKKLELFAEELLGLEKGILGFQTGELYLENNGNDYHIFLHANLKLDINTQENFINMSKNQKNESYKGFLGKIRLVTDTFLYTPTGAELDEYNAYAVNSINVSSFSPANYEMTWMFSKYKDDITEDSPEWDELEHSVLAKMADDIVVGARNNSVDIIVTKSFS